MKITHRNVPYSDIPRLVKEGAIKVGTRVKACSDQEKYPNGVVALHEDFGTVRIIKMLGISGFSVDDESIYYAKAFFLDILSDEEEELQTKECSDCGRIMIEGENENCVAGGFHEVPPLAKEEEDIKLKNLLLVDCSCSMDP
jgi:hypothetical protein